MLFLSIKESVSLTSIVLPSFLRNLVSNVELLFSNKLPLLPFEILSYSFLEENNFLSDFPINSFSEYPVIREKFKLTLFIFLFTSTPIPTGALSKIVFIYFSFFSKSNSIFFL